MVALLLLVGIAVAVFVGFNIGGSSTGVAFGPAVGSDTIGKTGAAALMSAFALIGGWTAGRQVIDTMSTGIVNVSFTLAASVAILFFVGFALLVSNLFGVPASTSMTAVGAIAGMGAAIGELNLEKMGEIVTWWFVAPILAFWVCAMIGRYLYPYLASTFPLGTGESSDVAERIGQFLVVAIGCYMAYSAGASNVANAVAPLVGANELSANNGVFLAGGAIALGAFTIARRTLDTVGNDLTDLPLLASLIVEVVSASLITFLSFIGIPASLAVSATMSIVGLGWGRATRTTTISEAATKAVQGQGIEDPDEEPAEAGVAMSALNADEPGKEVAPIGEEEPDELDASDLFDPRATGRVIMLWVATPSISAGASYALFSTVDLL
ncbi:inorganic phosphate transporter [Halorubellus litoreus]|uniref:Phosphate transporter n=1 Tax=Halorubellus litoreus TaxID=755308 RepID=A0ABD5VA12_9EURY